MRTYLFIALLFALIAGGVAWGGFPDAISVFSFCINLAVCIANLGLAFFAWKRRFS